MDSGSFAGVKALYSDARKRAAVAAGIGAYLYTSLEAVVLPIGPHARQVQAIRRQGKSDLLVLSAETEQWLRHGYQIRMSTEAVRRDLGEMLAHGEPENGIGQGEVADQAAQPASEPPAPEPADPGEQRARRGRDRRLRRPRTGGRVMSTDTTRSVTSVAIPARAARRADPDPAAAAAPSVRRPAAAAPLALQLQPIGPVSGDWRALIPRRRRSAPTGAMFLGRQVDDAVTLYYRRDPRPRRAPHRSTRSGTPTGMDGRPPPRPSASSSGSLGGRPARGQRVQARPRRDRAELRRARPAARRAGRGATKGGVHARARAWNGACSATSTSKPCGRTQTATSVPLVVDYKVKTTPLSQSKADHDFQPAVYLAGRWLEGDPAAAFAFAQIAKPGPAPARRSAASLVTHQPVGRAAARRARPDRAGSPADRRLLRAVRPRRALGVRRPGGWKCSERYCEAWQTCPGGAGL